jgi:hypothetical protein
MSSEIQELFSILKSLCKPEERDTITDMHAAFLYVDDYNAFAVRTPTGHSLCILNAYLAQTSTLLNAAIIDYTISTRFSKAGALAKSDVLIFSQTILQLCGLKVNDEHIRHYESYFFDDPMKQFLMSSLGVGQLTFVLAHEIGHHVLGHTQRAQLRRLFIDNPLEVEVYSREQEDEFAADEFALNLFRRFVEQQSVQPFETEKWGVTVDTLIAPILLMVYLECIENTVLGFTGERYKSITSHPPALHRRRKLMSALRQDFKKQQNELLRGVDFFLFKCLPEVARQPSYKVIEEHITPGGDNI